MNDQNSLIKINDIIRAVNIPNWYGRPLAKIIMSVLRLNRINDIYACNSHLKGEVFLSKVIDLAGIRYELNRQWQERIPKTGSFIIIANHPFGAIEGTLLLKNLIQLRPDIKILGNYLMTQIEPISNYILPVNPLKTNKSSFAGLKNALTHLRDGGSLIIFPAGQVSSWQESEQKITDRAWNESVIRLTQITQ
jgi:hypothetical protein